MDLHITAADPRQKGKVHGFRWNHPPPQSVHQSIMKDDYSWAWIEAQGLQCAEVWKACALPTLPELPRYSSWQQRSREKAYDEGLKEAGRAARLADRTPAGRKLARERITELFPRFATGALGLGTDQVTLVTESFLPVSAQLMQWTRAFDPEMSMEDTVQAARNAWIACGMQALVGQPMKLTPSVLAYSLLYPYSDNFLDQPEISEHEKIAFSERFRQRLRGRQLTARSRREASVWTMVRMIEEEHPRERSPQVFQSLLAIHQAQEESLGQLQVRPDRNGSSVPPIAQRTRNGWGTDCFLSAEQVLRISCAKGGSSVLADACLVRPDLTPQESSFSFQWGVLLQLGDDLQDVAADIERGSQTLFTLAVREGRPLDGLVRQLLHFSERVAEQMQRLEHGSAALKQLMRASWRLLILMAAADAQPFFTQKFLAELEPHSGFRFGFQRKRKEKLAGRQSLYAPLFDAFQEDAPGALSVPMALCEPWTESSQLLRAVDATAMSPALQRGVGVTNHSFGVPEGRCSCSAPV